MNNRFKFRVWDKITNQYLQELGIYYWHIPYSLDGEEITGEANLVGLSELLKHDNFVTQQYTGLTDINDKEIYEGDIVQYNQNSSYDNMDFIAKWSDDKLGFIFQSNSGEQLVNQTPHLNRFKHLEVVGNIFENPELLK
jgi:uncharacterized phage protein (TIGR01671 family)